MPRAILNGGRKYSNARKRKKGDEKGRERESEREGESRGRMRIPRSSCFTQSLAFFFARPRHCYLKLCPRAIDAR